MYIQVRFFFQYLNNEETTKAIVAVLKYFF